MINWCYIMLFAYVGLALFIIKWVWSWEILKNNPSNIKYITFPTKRMQKYAIEQSDFNLEIITYCPDWKDSEYVKKHLIVKDIIC